MKSRRRDDRAVTRRSLLQWASGGAALAALSGGASLSRRASAAEGGDPKLLFVVGALGGASIIDSFLPVAESEAGAAGKTLVAYPDAALVSVPGSSFRTVINVGGDDIFGTDYSMSNFLTRHTDDMVVVTQEVTSVNHVVAQQRALTGAGINAGRTIQEAVAVVHGVGMPLPNVNLASGGYLRGGDDPTTPTEARAEMVADPRLFALSTHGFAGIEGAPDAGAMAEARLARETAEGASPFLSRSKGAPMLGAYLAQRARGVSLEGADLITKLMLLQQGADADLGAYGLEQSPLLSRLLEVFPSLAEDPLEAQAALAFLLTRFGVSCAVTLSPNFIPAFSAAGDVIDTPLAFDFSHNDHVVCQNTMWGRMMKVVDGLITLLKEEAHLGDESKGAMWDRSLVYVATDFGRTKDRPSESISFSSGHDMNNGNVLLSPMLEGNRVFGGIDPKTCLTYGFDPVSGDPAPGTVMREGHVYSAVAQAMDVDFLGRHDMSAVIR